MIALARRGAGPPHICARPWPAGRYQCGDSGIVFASGSLDRLFRDPEPERYLAEQLTDPATYRTAFFEAFPAAGGFIRGEGPTIHEAELAAWHKHQRHEACDHHLWETRGYTNGAGFCALCGMFRGRIFETREQVAERRRLAGMTAAEILAEVRGEPHPP